MTAFGLPYRRALDFFGARSNQTSKSLPKHDPLILGLQTVPSAAFTSTPSRCIESADRTANDGLAKAATLLSAFSHEGTNRRALAENGCSDLKYSACGRQLPEEYLVKLREAQIIWILSDLLGNLPKRPSRYGKLLDDPLRYLSELRSHAKANERLSRYADLYRQWWSTAFFTSGDDVFYSLLEDMRRNVVIAPVTGMFYGLVLRYGVPDSFCPMPFGYWYTCARTMNPSHMPLVHIA
jgi:hypothetical protein